MPPVCIKRRRNAVKTLLAGLLTLGTMALAGAMPTPVQAQATTATPRPSPPATNSPPTAAQRLIGDVAPKLADLTDTVLFGDVWERPQLSKRDRSLVTVSALIAMNRPDQLRSHLTRARDNGLTETELVEAITHLAFYSGWPNAVTAVAVAREVFKKN
jgi:4-carboxymuconolactone decarboxylase